MDIFRVFSVITEFEKILEDYLHKMNNAYKLQRAYDREKRLFPTQRRNVDEPETYYRPGINYVETSQP